MGVLSRAEALKGVVKVMSCSSLISFDGGVGLVRVEESGERGLWAGRTEPYEENE